jgi:hypothetical protein
VWARGGGRGAGRGAGARAPGRLGARLPTGKPRGPRCRQLRAGLACKRAGGPGRGGKGARHAPLARRAGRATARRARRRAPRAAPAAGTPGTGSPPPPRPRGRRPRASRPAGARAPCLGARRRGRPRWGIAPAWASRAPGCRGGRDRGSPDPHAAHAWIGAPPGPRRRASPPGCAPAATATRRAGPVRGRATRPGRAARGAGAPGARAWRARWEQRMVAGDLIAARLARAEWMVVDAGDNAPPAGARGVAWAAVRGAAGQQLARAPPCSTAPAGVCRRAPRPPGQKPRLERSKPLHQQVPTRAHCTHQHHQALIWGPSTAAAGSGAAQAAGGRARRDGGGGRARRVRGAAHPLHQVGARPARGGPGPPRRHPRPGRIGPGPPYPMPAAAQPRGDRPRPAGRRDDLGPAAPARPARREELLRVKENLRGLDKLPEGTDMAVIRWGRGAARARGAGARGAARLARRGARRGRRGAAARPWPPRLRARRLVFWHAAARRRRTRGLPRHPAAPTRRAA